MSGDPFESCALTVRRVDPDRYFSALFAPAAIRPHLFALYAFNHELAHAVESVRDPMIGEIRLQWWRETLAGARSGMPRRHDVAMALAGSFEVLPLPFALLEAMVDARSLDLQGGTFTDEPGRDAYVDATSGNLMRLAARVLGAGDRHDGLAREAGLAYGLAGLLRNRAHPSARQRLLSDAGAAQAARDARAHLQGARRQPPAKSALAAFLPASLVPLYLRDPSREIALHRRQLRLLGAALRGRI
jgi:phytoene/squalene synthetase